MTRTRSLPRLVQLAVALALTLATLMVGPAPADAQTAYPADRADIAFHTDATLDNLVVNQSGQTNTNYAADRGYSCFPDLDGLNTQDRESICRLKYWGVISGYPDGTFRPGNAVRRDQMASFISNGMNLANYFHDSHGTINERLTLGAWNGCAIFTDVTCSNVHRVKIGDIYVRNITIGCQVHPDGTKWYCPSSNLTLNQLDTFMVRWFSAQSGEF